MRWDERAFCIGEDIGTVGFEEDGNPYKWLEKLGSKTTTLHVQQTDKSSSRHWPFTEKYNKLGIIEAPRVIEAIEKSGNKEIVLILEIFHPPFEPTDSQVVDDLKKSVEYWRQYMDD